MSSGISLCAYQGSDGVYVEFTSQDESSGLEHPGQFSVWMKDNTGKWICRGSVPAVGIGNNNYRLLVSGMTVGNAYTIMIVDESGNHWTASNVSVTPFAASMVKMSPMGLSMQFSTLPGHSYDIQWTPKLGGEWITTSVSNLIAVGTSTNVFVFFPDATAPSGFFRILMH